MSETTLVILALVATAVFLAWWIRWDLRRTFAEIDHLRGHRPVEPVDFEGEIRAYKVSKDQREAGERRVAR